MLQEVLAVLESVKKAGDGYVARCPAHEDSTASLSIKDKGDEWPLFHCFTGCTFESVREAVEAKGVKREREDRSDYRPAPVPRTVTRRTPYQIRDAAGELLCSHVRLEWSDGGKTFAWQMPNGARKLEGLKVDDMLYGLEQLSALDPSRVVILTEGEKAAHFLAAWGMPGALGTVCGASSTPSAQALEHLRGRTVLLWPDNDDAGNRHMDRTAKALDGIAAKVRVIHWEAAPPKGDAADWLSTPRTHQELGALIAQARKPGGDLWPEGVTPIYSPELMKRTLKDMEDFGRGDRPGVVSTGFSKLDRAIRGGFEPGEVYLLGAPTGGGKTTIMQSLGASAAKEGPVLFVTPEMTLVSLLRRELIRRSGMREDDVSHWADQAQREMAWAEFSRSAGGVLEEKPPLLILDKTDVTMDDVEAAAEQIDGLRMVLIDYAQQVADMDGRTPRYLQVGDVALRSIDLAHRLQVPVVLASQVNVIKPKGKEGKRIYSFRESSVMEQKAAVVIIFDRKDHEDESNGPDPIEAQWMCGKNRHGYAFRSIEAEWWPWLYQVAEPTPPPQLPIPTDRREPYKGDDD